MLQLIRTNSTDSNFQLLVRQLDIELAKRNGIEHDFFAQYNKTDMIRHVVLAFIHETVVACGAMKEFNKVSMEIKRMFALPEMRGKGAAHAILHELESWAAELGYQSCVLETGHKMPEAIGLYRKSGYKVIPNYGQYAGIDSSICFEKLLAAHSPY